MESVEEMRAVCVAHYVERGYTPAYAESYIGNKESEIRRIYIVIQEEKKRKIKVVSHKIAGLNIQETILVEEENAAE